MTDIEQRELDERNRVVAEARKWILTPYHNGADVRGAGVDCGMLIVRVFVDLGLVPPFDPRPYDPDWMLHRDDEKYLRFFTKVTTTACLAVARCPSYWFESLRCGKFPPRAREF